ncbi:uncharacterized protein AB675_2568 [Cyphellophora attinorum]|uniref:Yeast cell wall synthesis Kre9/Knh1-like N-terminal domain-containing protein n=1 Tax=Cyphellophora attinorum TaxID=1664694 RepID=A0A0N1I0C6_9EURO|nr:uncharacterized protein AB675_2568 [Phialophora attinorum]KPI44887.1 hypothetical protein AB675_2568 [Phialophora attinorum]
MLARVLVAAASLLSVAFAQSNPKVAFTSVPAVVEAGETYNITWGGGNDTPVTLTLRKGDPADLETIAIIADRVSGSSYQWEVSEDLENASDYALQITQGQDDINYSGLFSLTGGSAASSGTISITSSTTRTGNSTMTSTASITSATNGTMMSNGTESTTATETTDSSATGSMTSATGTTSASRTSAAATSAATVAPSSGGAGVVSVQSAIALGMALLGAVLFLE